MALGDLVFIDSSIVAIQAFGDTDNDLVPLQSDDGQLSALISGSISKSPQSIIRARATMGESFTPSIPSKAWSADIDLQLRVDGYQTDSVIIPILNKIVPPQASTGQWLLKVAFQAHKATTSAVNPIYKIVVALETHTPINPGDSSAEQTFTLRGGAYRYIEDPKATFDKDSTTGALKNDDDWPTLVK